MEVGHPLEVSELAVKRVEMVRNLGSGHALTLYLILAERPAMGPLWSTVNAK